jgi:hypothetical protein
MSTNNNNNNKNVNSLANDKTGGKPTGKGAGRRRRANKKSAAAANNQLQQEHSNQAKIVAVLRKTARDNPNMIRPMEFAMTKAQLFAHFPKLAIEAIQAMMLPSQFDPMRFPGNAYSPTAVIRTIREVLIVVNFDGTANAGRFSLALSPGIGTTTPNPKDWQLSMVNTNGAWPIDLTLPASYVQSVPGPMGGDYRLDPRAPELTQPALGNGTGTYAALYGATAPAAPLFTGTPTYQIDNSGLYPTLTNGTPTASSSTWTLPVGQYLLTLSVRGYSPEGAALIPVTTGGNATALLIDSFYLLTNATNPISYEVYAVSVYDSSGKVFINNPYTLGVAQTALNWSAGYFPQMAPPIPLNGGLMKKYRPTACSILVSNTNAQMYTGGTIVSNLVDNQTLVSKYYIPNSYNSLANWENLLSLQGRPPYSGEVKDGSYTFYVPLDTSHTNFYTPDASALAGYPQIIVSGQFSNAAGVAGVQNVARAQIIHDYEYITDSQVPSIEYTDGTLPILDKVLSAFEKGAVSCPNGLHFTHIKKFIAGLPKVISDVNGVIQSGSGILKSFGL